MLNAINVKRLKPRVSPTGKPVAYRVADTGGVQGLGVNVSPTGHRSYVLSWRDGSKKKYHKIGDVDDISLSDARDRARNLRRKIKNEGYDPSQTAREMTYGTVWDLFEHYKAYLKRESKKSREEIAQLLNKEAMPQIGDMFAKDVKPEDVADVIRPLSVRGALTNATRLRSYLRSMFHQGMSADLDTTVAKKDLIVRFNIQQNPVDPVPVPKRGSTALDRWLSEDEIRATWQLLPYHANPVQVAAVKLLFCTGQRTEEVLSMRWTDIEDDVWFLPTTKNGRPHEVPLNELATEVLDWIRPITAESQVVFPQLRSRTVPTDSTVLNNAIRRMAKAKNLQRYTPRDIRRTVKSMALKYGIDKQIMDRVQNHARRDVSEAHYVRYGFLREKREALEEWNAILQRIINNKSDSATLCSTPIVAEISAVF